LFLFFFFSSNFVDAKKNQLKHKRKRKRTRKKEKKKEEMDTDTDICMANTFDAATVADLGADRKSIAQDGDVTQNGDALIFNPFNPENKEITLNDVQHLLLKYGVGAPIDNLELYKRAFVHSSYTKRPAIENERNHVLVMPCPANCLPLKTKSNERLEFIGDGVLELITKYYLYRRFPKADEGFMTEKKIALVKNEHIGRIAQEMQLPQWVLLSRYAEEKKTRHNLKKLGCLFEAFIGAIFLDFNKIKVQDEAGWFTNVFVTGPGFQMAQIFVENVLEQHVDWHKLISTDDNYKNILQVIIQKEFKTTPDYLELGHTVEQGYDMGVFLCLGKPIYELKVDRAVPLSNFANFEAVQQVLERQHYIFVFLAHGVHKIKKKAEQLACENALQLIARQANSGTTL
jgi:dsRNA-specific ribonuclease